MGEESKVYGTESFISDVLPNLTKSRKSLGVVFSTYNSVGGYETGFAKTGKDGLEIFVVNGCRQNDPIIFATQLAILDSPDPLAFQIFAETKKYNEADAQKSLGCVHDTSLATFDVDSEFLYFTYIGLNAMIEAINFVEEIKNTHPKATVIAVVCDCNISHKERVLAEASKAGKVDFVIVCQICGGVNDMRKLLEGLIDVWENKE